MGGFTINPQTLLVVTDMSDGLVDGDTSGIMGLAFQSLASTGAVPFWQALTNAGQFASPEMSFWLTRFLDVSNPTDDEPGGVFTLGGTNSTLFTGDIEFLDLAATSSANSATFWLLQMSSTSIVITWMILYSYYILGLTVNGQNVQISTGDAALSAIDTGTTLIGGPTDGVQALYSAISGSQALSGQMEGFFAYRSSSCVT